MENVDFKMFDNFIQSVLSGLPKFLGAIGLLILGYVIARVVRAAVRTFLAKIKVDKLADKLEEIDLVAKSKIKIVPSKIIASLIYYLLLIIFVVAVTDMLNLTTVSTYLTSLINYLPQAFTAFAFFIAGLLFSDFLRKVVYTAAKSIGIPSAKVISTILFYFLFINVFISALTQAGIDTEFIQSNLTMIIGGIVFAFGLGYGIASKDIMASVLAGYYNKRLHEGDRITIGSVTGTITSISKTDLIVTNESDSVIIPLSEISKGVVIVHQTKDNKN
ncbi:MAG TPA: mechanosensitive ion channel [Saprospiraceae bacterium]|jgi:hypothetical protein|nr:MAG: TM helix repeat-containing protein [Candidatus Parvibacillus calidus]MBX2936439.1 mechanosensitive ion channel [Saprospiraceae bacterium]MBK7739253.1 mechanosensitive ion channel [Candidatus Parvibacillus calidus]MCB0592164.1 mechanosensitive ion channel [Saprospiraceae bacterium]MCC7149317.1 mechanosensitive ion channel [Saprospiraceae bacterium]